MRKIREALHRGPHNVPPSAAQSTAAPAPVPASTLPGTGVGGAPVLQPATTGLQQTAASTLQQPLAGTGLGTAPLGTGLGAGALGTGLGGTGAPLTSTGGAPLLSSASTATPGFATGMTTTTTTSGTSAAVIGKETRIVEQERFVTAAPAQQTMITETAPVTRVEAPFIEHREKAPVVQEVIKPGVREEIQPVIHREREQLELREEILPIYEKSVQPTIVEERQLAPEIRPELRLGAMPVMQPGPVGSVVTEREHVETVMRPAIVEEVVHKKIIEEVQPVIHRETIAPRVIRETKPIYEKVIEAPVVTYETLPARYTSASEYRAPALAEETVVTTTTVEREFIPGTSGSSLSAGRATNLSGAPMTTTSTLPGTTGFSSASTLPSTSSMGSTLPTSTSYTTSTLPSSSAGLGTTSMGAPITEFREMKIEESTTAPGSFQNAPSTYQRY